MLIVLFFDYVDAAYLSVVMADAVMHRDSLVCRRTDCLPGAPPETKGVQLPKWFGWMGTGSGPSRQVSARYVFIGDLPVCLYLIAETGWRWQSCRFRGVFS